MLDFAIMMEWIEFAVRWLHVITAIAWIGSSFYFIALDLGLHRDRNLTSGADGEEWQVHGGGFYHIQKYLVAPKNMPDDLIWFKWESYSTWLSGAALLALVYYLGADLYLVDSSKTDISTGLGILISALSLSIGWIVYNALSKSKLSEQPTLLMVLLFGLLMVMGYAYDQIFTGRAVLLHLGAFTATIMTANVFFIIMPNQRIVVADLKAGRKPDAKYGKIAKLRSTHNNYLTLPVIFLMLSNHYPLSFGTQYNWVIAGLVFLMGVTIRHFFNSKHARQGYKWWTWAVTAVLFIMIIWISTVMRPAPAEIALSGEGEALATSVHFEKVQDIVATRCLVCHSETPAWQGIYWPPKAVAFDHPNQIAQLGREIYLQAGVSAAMPPANVANIPEDERKIIRQWYQSVAPNLAAN